MRAQFYSSTDLDAPVLDGSIGSLINLLDAILVNGYGVKEPLGWTKEFSGTNIAVYRNSTSDPLSSGMYLRVDNSTGYGAVTSSMTRCLVRGYKTMSDVDTGIDPTHECFWNSVVGTNTAQDWYCVGDHRTFYLNRSNNPSFYSYLLSSILAAGDYKSYVPVNPYNYFVTSDRTASTSSGSSGVFPAGNQSITIPRPGSLESVAIWCNPEFSPGTSWLSIPGGDRQFQTFRIVQATNGVYAVGELRGVLVTRENLGGQTGIYPSGTDMGSNPFSPGEDLTNLRTIVWQTVNVGHIQVSSGEWDG